MSNYHWVQSVADPHHNDLHPPCEWMVDVLKLGQALLFTLQTLIHILLFPSISNYRLRSCAIILGLFFYYGLIFLLEAEMYVNHFLILLNT